MKPWEISHEVAAKLTELVDKYGGNKIIFSIKEVAAESGYDAKTIKKCARTGPLTWIIDVRVSIIVSE